jgi:hypothetical protein
VHPAPPPNTPSPQLWGCDLGSITVAHQCRLATLDASGQVRLWDIGSGVCERAAQMECASKAPFVGLCGTSLPGGGFLLVASTRDAVQLVTLGEAG